MPIRQINAITSLLSWQDSGEVWLAIETQFPSDPRLYATCHGYQDIPKERDRQGQIVPHGFKKWIQIVDLDMPPTACSPTMSAWKFAWPCPGGAKFWFWFAELGRKPFILWDSTIYDSDDIPQRNSYTHVWDTDVPVDNSYWWPVFGGPSKVAGVLDFVGGEFVDIPANGTWQAAFSSTITDPYAGASIAIGIITFENGVYVPIAQSPPYNGALSLCPGPAVLTDQRASGPGVRIARGAINSGTQPGYIFPGNDFVVWFEPN